MWQESVHGGFPWLCKLSDCPLSEYWEDVELGHSFVYRKTKHSPDGPVNWDIAPNLKQFYFICWCSCCSCLCWETALSDLPLMNIFAHVDYWFNWGTVFKVNMDIKCLAKHLVTEHGQTIVNYKFLVWSILDGCCELTLSLSSLTAQQLTIVLCLCLCQKLPWIFLGAFSAACLDVSIWDCMWIL